MPELSNIRRIITEDFPTEDRETVAKLASILNFFMEEVTNTVNGELDFDNLKRGTKTIEITVDANGTPIGTDKFTFDNGLQGTKVIRATNLANRNIYPTSHPFVTFEPIDSGVYRINNISGLQANTKYSLVLELIL